MDPNIKQSIVDRLKQTNNVLVTVKNSPSVDQLSACIGLTLFLNKLGKHATAVFSGEVPSTIEFLKPNDTLEKDTNSLRDFIISLDKSKADKLRYKVEDQVVRIFITPYKTSLSEKDLDFSQGDFNVDVVIAIGVHMREELDQAIMAHGRILHDATIVSINNSKPADLGALNWNDSKASSLSEMVASLADQLQPNKLDAQMATAFLTGIVAETERFSNSKTTPITMSISSKLMASGANQQLVATKLEEPTKVDIPQAKPKDKKEVKNDGELEIEHPELQESSLPLPPVEGEVDQESEIHIDEQGNFKTGLQDRAPKENNKNKSANKESDKPSRLALEPPTLGSALTANTQVNQLDPSIDPLSGESPNEGIIGQDSKQTADEPLALPKEGNTLTASDQTLSALEEQVGSPHIRATSSMAQPGSLPTQNNPHEDGLQPISHPKPNLGGGLNQANDTFLGQPSEQKNSSDLSNTLDGARRAVEEASQLSEYQPNPLQSLNAQPLGENLNSPLSNGQQGVNNNAFPDFVPQNNLPAQDQSGASQPPTPPPPVPPPMMPPSS